MLRCIAHVSEFQFLNGTNWMLADIQFLMCSLCFNSLMVQIGLRFAFLVHHPHGSFNSLMVQIGLVGQCQSTYRIIGFNSLMVQIGFVL